MSITFRRTDSGSRITITWHDGRISHRLNGKRVGRTWPLDEPESRAAFEALCRRWFLLDRKWRAL
jgi:hypothetical protein